MLDDVFLTNFQKNNPTPSGPLFAESWDLPQQPRSATSHFRGVETEELLSASLRPRQHGYSLYSASLTHPTSTSRHHHHYEPDSIIAVIDNKCGDVGIASCSLRTFVVTISQFSDTSAYSKCLSHVNSLQPIEVVVPHTAAEGKLSLTLQGALPEVAFTAIQRRFFNEIKGTQKLTELAPLQDPALLEIANSENYLCVSAAAALMQYVESVQRCVFVPHTVRVRYLGLAHYVELDRSSISSLQLLSPFQSQHWFNAGPQRPQPSTLIHVLDRTTTPMGARCLRANILQPLRELNSLEMRFDAVEYLLASPSRYSGLKQAISALKNMDIEQIISVFSHEPKVKTMRTAQCLIGCIIQLREALVTIPQLKEKLSSEHCIDTSALEGFVEGDVVEAMPSLLLGVKEALSHPEFEELTYEVRQVLDEEVLRVTQSTKKVNAAVQQVQHCFAVRPNVSSVLDMARKRYSASIEQMYQLCEELKAQHNVSSLKVLIDGQRRSCLQYDSRDERQADPTVFLHKVQRGHKVMCTTRKMDNFNFTNQDALLEVLQCEEAIVEELVRLIRGKMGRLHSLCESVALLDMLLSHATFTMSQDTAVRPSIHLDGPMELQQCVHPVLAATQRSSMRANDFSLSPDRSVMILTAPNAGGKTTFLRQVAQLSVIAHVGCFVPAKLAKFPLLDRIMGRMSCDDLAEAAASAFVREMRDISVILQRATSQSLVLIDELGRGTSNVEGSCIAWAVTEWLADCRSFTLFATHFLNLTQLPWILPSVCNKHFLVSLQTSGNKNDSDRNAPQRANVTSLRFEYTLADGPCQMERYGLELAKRVGFPADVLERAEGKLQLLHRGRLGKAQMHLSSETVDREKGGGKTPTPKKNVEVLSMNKQLQTLLGESYHSPLVRSTHQQGHRPPPSLLQREEKMENHYDDAAFSTTPAHPNTTQPAPSSPKSKGGATDSNHYQSLLPKETTKIFQIFDESSSHDDVPGEEQHQATVDGISFPLKEHVSLEATSAVPGVSEGLEESASREVQSGTGAH